MGRGRSGDGRRATAEFEDRLEAEVERKRYASAANAVHRLVHAFGIAADTDVAVGLAHPGFIGIRIAESAVVDKRICGGGLIRHARIGNLEALAAFASEQDQTVTHYGFEREALVGLAADRRARAWTSIVPVGEALAFR